MMIVSLCFGGGGGGGGSGRRNRWKKKGRVWCFSEVRGIERQRRRFKSELEKVKRRENEKDDAVNTGM